MKNIKLLPFERNRYFTGKMLTSADFAAEQRYINNKRRFINNMMFGTGIVCGMSVEYLDEKNIKIDSGVAIDGYGREVVIPDAQIKKLSAIEGFEETQKDSLCIYAAYSEENIQPVYSASRKSKKDEYENNRIMEGCRIYIKDDVEDELEIIDQSEFLLQKELLANEDVKIVMQMPAVVCIGKMVKVRIRLIKLSSENININYKAALQFPAFTDENGGHEQEIVFRDIVLDKERYITEEIWLKSEDIQSMDTGVMLKRGSVECMMNDTQVAAEDNIIFSVRCVYDEPAHLIDSYIGKKNLDERVMTYKYSDICLARVHINRLSNSYEIVKITETDVKEFIETPADEQERQEYAGFFKENRKGSSKEYTDTALSYSLNPNTVAVAQNMTSGIVEIPIGGAVKKGEVFYSEEIIHGLGKGNVYVSLGHQIQEKHDGYNELTNTTIIGNGSIFADTTVTSNLETAVKVLNDKGSFIVGVKAVKDMECTIVSYRWFAVNFTAEYAGNDAAYAQDGRITAETPTAVLKPQENYFFNVRFNNMEPRQLGYELTEEKSGHISVDGIYTAPNKEGVYEIRIYCLNDPSICTYAYAIVKRTV